MQNPKRQPLRDRRYLNSFCGRSCWNCGSGDDTVIGAHIRWGQEGGIGLKPSDDLTVPLCWRCHAEQEANPGPLWWAQMVKNMARLAYQQWRARS